MGKRDRKRAVTIGDRVREHRERLGWTQEQLTAALEWKAMRVYRIERGLIRVLADDVRQLADVLGVPATDLLGAHS